jgi:hypothetical protein
MSHAWRRCTCLTYQRETNRDSACKGNSSGRSSGIVTTRRRPYARSGEDKDFLSYPPFLATLAGLLEVTLAVLHGG